MIMHLCPRVLHSVIMSCGWTFVDSLPLSLRGLVVSFCLWSEPNVSVSVRSFQRCGFSLLPARVLADILALHHLITHLCSTEGATYPPTLCRVITAAIVLACSTVFKLLLYFPALTFDSPLVLELWQPAVSMSLGPWLSPNFTAHSLSVAPSVTVWLTSRLYKE